MKIFRTLIAILLLATKLCLVKGQLINDTLILNSEVPGGDYVAKNWIELRAGFSFTPQAPEIFSATTGESAISALTYLSTPPDINRPIDISLPVGTTTGSYDVSQTGALTYNIPINVPPGTAGMQPNLSINYNSQGGNGLMGIGWSFSGISTITRVPADYYHEGFIDGVDLDDNDRFTLDGNRLIMIGSGIYGGDNVEYRTESESFSVIKSYDNNGDNSPEYYKVWTKDGYEIEYGTDQTCRIEINNKVIAWYIRKMKDPYGNYMVFNYEIDNGLIYIAEINYTGNNDVSPNIVPYNSIKFSYITRKDTAEYFLLGNSLKQKKIIYRIESFNNDILTHAYEFKYTYNIFSQLSEIYEIDSENNYYNSLMFHWDIPVSSVDDETTNFDSNLRYLYYTGDFNGDGKTDFVTTLKKTQYTINDKWSLYINVGDYNFVKTWEGPLVDGFLSFPKADDYYYMKNLGFQAYDFNGDGLDDIVLKRYIDLSIYHECDAQGVCQFYSYYTYLSNGSSFTQSMTYGNYHLADKVLFGDFNGDGKTECQVIPEDDDLINFKFHIIDFNGDGKDDIMAINNNSSFDIEDACIIFDGNSTTELYHSGFPTKWHRIYPGDFNGDGKTDVLTWTSGNGWQIAFSTDIGFS